MSAPEREADRLIEAGKVTVDGMKATVGMQIEEGQKVCLNGKPVQKDKKDKAHSSGSE